MTKEQLHHLLDAEIDAWSSQSFASLVEQLADVVAHERGDGDDYRVFEVQMVEKEPGYVHVVVSIDDGSLGRSLAPLTRDFIVHRDGRVET